MSALYSLQLFYEQAPGLGEDAVLAALRSISPSVDRLPGRTESGIFAFLHRDHLVSAAGGRLPAQTLVSEHAGMPERASLDESLRQSWTFPNAETVLQRCRASVLITDFMGAPLDRRGRLTIVEQTLDAVLALSAPLAIHWMPAQQVIAAEAWRQAAPRPYPDLRVGPINVRLWRVSGTTAGATVMDTRGLDVFGLPDVQCRFQGLDPDAVARVLYNTASYLFQNGDVIEDGHAVPGVGPGEAWPCRHAPALIAPKRVVLDAGPR